MKTIFRFNRRIMVMLFTCTAILMMVIQCSKDENVPKIDYTNQDIDVMPKLSDEGYLEFPDEIHLGVFLKNNDVNTIRTKLQQSYPSFKSFAQRISEFTEAEIEGILLANDLSKLAGYYYIDRTESEPELREEINFLTFQYLCNELGAVKIGDDIRIYRHDFVFSFDKEQFADFLDHGNFEVGKKKPVERTKKQATDIIELRAGNHICNSQYMFSPDPARRVRGENEVWNSGQWYILKVRTKNQKKVAGIWWTNGEGVRQLKVTGSGTWTSVNTFPIQSGIINIDEMKDDSQGPISNMEVVTANCYPCNGLQYTASFTHYVRHVSNNFGTCLTD